MISIEKSQVKWKPKAQDIITKDTPDKIVYAIARTTLDMSFATIPKDRGQLRASSKAYGVQGSNGDYSIGSKTDYAKYVYNMPDKTNWTTTGTHGQWYPRYWKQYGNVIFKQAVERNKLK